MAGESACWRSKCHDDWLVIDCHLHGDAVPLIGDVDGPFERWDGVKEGMVADVFGEGGHKPIAGSVVPLKDDMVALLAGEGFHLVASFLSLLYSVAIMMALFIAGIT